ncbi:uncharacterized protein L201_001230 [Kwoniella dendrophila CBS 6074]|uniref:Zn(2)-C6 fungal-type domain-containing protein n=1 Tax=Kwoniella dendrophila CBS 6074 TaxID=1295534 RepID=A0AAX4JLQ2_9TREE
MSAISLLNEHDISNPYMNYTDNTGQRASSANSSEQQNDKDIPKVLARNSACHQCRKRKLKCDATKPICTNCSKPRQRGTGKGESNAEIEACTWDEPKEPSARTRRRRESARRQAEATAKEKREEDDSEVSAKRAKLNELEGRIAACQDVLEGQRQGMNQSVPPPNIPFQNPPFTSLPNPTSDNQQSYKYPPQSTSTVSYITQNEPNYMGQGSLSTTIPKAETSIHGSANNQDTWPTLSSVQNGSEYVPSTENLMSNQSKSDVNGLSTYADPSQPDPLAGLFDLIWPDWPKELPKHEIVEHAIRVFFEKVPTLPKMLNKNQLLRNLLLPPSHYDFPVRPLLHAILAISANFISETSLATKEYFPVGASVHDITHPTRDFNEPRSKHLFNFTTCSATQGPELTTPFSKFQLWHRRKAFETFSQYLDRGDKFLQCMQGYLIATVVDQYNAWWTDLWMESGSCLRMATPMRINESPNVPENSLRRGASALLGPAKTEMEQAERDRTWWMAYMLERSATAATTWPPCLSEEEITVELPVLQSTFDYGYGELQGVQTIQSPDIYTSHPPRHRDSFCFLIKSIKLYTEVQTFFRRYNRGTHSIAGYLSHPTFRVLLSQINTFRMSFPPDFRRPTHFKVGEGVAAFDRDLILSLWVLHGASICLGEPLVTKDTWTHEGARMTLAAIRAALSLLYDITATSYDLTLFNPHCSFTWCLASRALIRFMDAAIESGDSVSASVFRSELEVFRLALQRFAEKFAVSIKHLKMVDDLLLRMNEQALGSKPFTVYDCTTEDIVITHRHIGGSASVSETSSHAVYTPGGQSNTSGFTPKDQDKITSISPTTEPNIPTKSQPHQNLNGPNLDPKNNNNNNNNNGINNFGNFGGGFGIPTPATSISDVDLQNTWDINSFSFDINAMVSIFENNGAVFDGSSFSMAPPQ